MVGGGRLVIRHFVLAMHGHQLEPNDEHIFRQFEGAGGRRDHEASTRYLAKEKTDIRCSAILAAVREDGRIDEGRLSEFMGRVTENLRRRYDDDPLWDVFAPEFEAPMPKGYDEARPHAAPPWG